MASLKKTRIRGQIPIENLILYSVVILIVLIALFLLWQTKILSPMTWKRGYVGFSQVVPTDWVMAQNDETKSFLAIKNEGESPIRISAESIDLQVGKIQCAQDPDDPTFDMQPGESRVVRMSCPGLGNEYQLGEYYEADITIAYVNIDTDRDHTSVGKLYGYMEIVPPDWVPTTTTGTTGTTVPRCFYHQCTPENAGLLDNKNCGEIKYLGKVGLCRYCSRNPDSLGIYRCQYAGRCNTACQNDGECKDPANLDLNPCKYCNLTSHKCEESPGRDNTTCNNQCLPTEAGTLGGPRCDTLDITNGCPYCKHEFILQPDGSSLDSYTCKTKKNCGDPCNNIVFDDYSECKEQCTHCNITQTPGVGICAQGDCGRRCGYPGDKECNLGCDWCNSTGENPTYRCEMGDCGKSCSDSDQCNLGCMVCQDGTCVHLDIGVTLVAHNGTFDTLPGGGITNPKKIVKEGGDIYLNSTGTAQGQNSVERLLISSSVTIPPENIDDATGYCKSIADERNELGPVTDPNGGDDADTSAWRSKWGISWPTSHVCVSPPDDPHKCFYVETTSKGEDEIGAYCYFTIAQNGKTGEWTAIASDYIQVGYLNVYLVLPRPYGVVPHNP